MGGAGGEGLEKGVDRLAVEAPLAIRVGGGGGGGGRTISVTMRTPGRDEELAAGFLLGEGVISRREDVAHIRRCEDAAGSAVEVFTAEGVTVDFARLTRHVFASSSCGVCGLASIEAVRRACTPIARRDRLGAGAIARMEEGLRGAQPTFDETGGLHAAGLFDLEGRLLVAREDVGRHNAVDKVIGHAFLAGGGPAERPVLMVSGRASFEIVQKAAMAGIQVVAAVSAPSSLAVELAQELNITLAGFVRAGRMNVYAHEDRLEGALGG